MPNEHPRKSVYQQEAAKVDKPKPRQPTRYTQDLCNELDNNAREISWRMTASGGPTRDEAREVIAYIARQRAILSILETKAEKERMK